MPGMASDRYMSVMSPTTTHAKRESRSAARTAALQAVYEAFDLDGNGGVGFEEILALGKARRELGQKQGRWTPEMAERMMDNLGQDTTGHVSMANFVTYFDGILPSDDAGLAI